MEHAKIATKQDWTFEVRKAPAYLVTVIVPVQATRDQIDTEGADAAAMSLGRLILDAIKDLDGEVGTI